MRDPLARRLTSLVTETGALSVHLVYRTHMESAVDAATRGIRERIRAGEWGPGDRIDTFAELQRRYGLPGVSSVQNALAPLKREGLLDGRHGRGTFVVGPTDPADAAPENLSEPADDVRALLEQAESLLVRARARLDETP